MDDSGIWAMVIIVSVVIMVVTFLTSVTVLHKKFVEKPIEKMEDKEKEELAAKDTTNKETPHIDTTNKDMNVKNPEGV
jgi:hypothetical protein